MGRVRELMDELSIARDSVKLLEAELSEERKKCDHDMIEVDTPGLPGSPSKFCRVCGLFQHPLGLL